jgi:hypothetical protein
MAFSFPVRVLWFLLAISLPVWACGTRAPYLNPVTPGSDSSNGSNEVVVEIKPVDTSGFRNPEQERLGIDLSAYYTAFEVTFRNGTSRVVNLDSRDAVLLDDDQKTYTVLSVGESLDYYQSGGMPGEKTVVIPKSLAVGKDEMEKIRRLRLKSGEIPPGGTETGFLLFRKVPEDKCHQISLSLKGVRISGEDRNREFRFGFSCPGS